MKYSIVVPVYNRPDETAELIESLSRQTMTDYELIVVEDGSDVKCDHVCQQWKDKMNITYLEKDNSGPGPSRNYGAQHAKGQYIIILDSDVVLPENYLKAIDNELNANPCDAFGGPDAAHPDFTNVQKAISYSMTSFFTTGGIRGGKKKLDRFYPRSFNMGIAKNVYEQLGGYADMRFGEDIDFSLRIYKAGLKCRLFPDAWVWHKRRTDFRKFWKQVFNSGIARINLQQRHPGSLKAVHLMPAVFTLGTALLATAAITLHPCFIIPLALYAGIIATDATIRQRSVTVGALAVAAAFTQLTGYGCGFLSAAWKRLVMKKGEYQAYKNNFYQ